MPIASAGVMSGRTTAVEPVRRNGSRTGSPSAVSRARREDHGPTLREDALDERVGQGLRAGEHRGGRLAKRRVGDVHGPGLEHPAPLAGHADRRRVDAEDLHHRAGDRLEGRLEREAPREGVRDLEEPAQLMGGAALG